MNPMRGWATVPRAEAHIVSDREGSRWIAYAGPVSALTLLESAARGYATAEQIQRYNPGIAGPAAWLLLPVERWGFLLAETCGKLEHVGSGYLETRKRVVGSHDKFAHLYPETPPGLPTPFRHQIECFSATLEAIERGGKGFGSFLEMGLGRPGARWIWPGAFAPA